MAKMTLDNLAVMIKREFDRINKKLNDHDKQFTKIDQRFDKIDQRFTKIDSKLDSMQTDILSFKLELLDINLKLDRLEKRTFEDDDAFASDIIDLRKRVKVMERKIVKLQASKK